MNRMATTQPDEDTIPLELSMRGALPHFWVVLELG